MHVRDTLLLACGTPESRKALHSIFEDSFNLLEADNTHQAAMLLEQNHSCIALIIIDTTAPEKLDQIMTEKIRLICDTEDIPVLVLANEDSASTILSSMEQGAADVVFSDYDPVVLLHQAHRIVDLYHHKWNLEELVDEQSAILRSSNEAMVDALSSIIEYRSAESGQHILRIRHFTKILLEEVAANCPEYRLTPAMIKLISSASALHDIGKISIPDSILNKPAKLTAEEWIIMRSHAATGCRILETLGDMGNPDYMRYAHNICHYHHERWDGNGYPEGLSGDLIPICAQVVGLADAYDALTSKRVYKDAFSCDTAANMIINGECGIFSPKLLECFKVVVKQFEALAKEYADGLSPKTESFAVSLPAPQPQKGIATLESVQSKYQSLLHFINGTAMEIDMEQQIFHLIYNPYPELAALGNSTSFDKAIRFMLSIVQADEQKRLKHFLYEDIPYFLRSGRRKQSHLFHLCTIGETQSTLYQATLLRSDFEDNTQRFILIWQKAAPADISAMMPATADSTPHFHPDALHQLRIGRISFYHDIWYTLKSMGTETAAILDYTEEEINTFFHGHLIETVLPEDRKLVQQYFHDQLKTHGDAELTFRIRQKNEPFLWVLLKGCLSVDNEGKEYLSGILIDIHRSKMNQDKLKMDLMQYQALFANTQNVTYEWDMITDTIHFSEQWYDIFGYHPQNKHALAKIATNSHLHPEDIPQLYGLIHNLQQGTPQQTIDIRIAKADGRYLWCRFLATAIHDDSGKLLKTVGIVLNIDEEKRAARALRKKAEQDSLTKLLNKTTAAQQAEEYISSVPDGAPCALLVIDLDNFKQVNDLYGHMFGDTVLERAAAEIKRLFRTQDIIGRIGGDEFMVLMQGTADPSLAQSRCERLIHSLENMFRSQMPGCSIGCSIGVALAPAHGKTYGELFQKADHALYQVKRGEKNGFLFYDDAELSPLSHTSSITALNASIDSDDAPELVYSNIIQHAFRHLYESGDVEAAMQNVLDMIGRQLNISRVYIFENSEDNAYCSNTFEWCNEGIAPEIRNLQNISYEQDVPTFLDNFHEQDVFCCSDISTLPFDLRNILEPQGIKSLLHCAIRDNGVFRGYVGFDDCKNKRFWTKDQINLLTSFSQMVSIILLKKRAQDTTSRYVGNLHSILDNQNAWIYVIDPNSYKLKFLNAKTMALAPEAKIGMYCYQALTGRESRCPNCPAQNIRQEKTAEQIIFNDHFQLEVMSEATLIQWENETSCMLTCRHIKKDIGNTV